MAITVAGHTGCCDALTCEVRGTHESGDELVGGSITNHLGFIVIILHKGLPIDVMLAEILIVINLSLQVHYVLGRVGFHETTLDTRNAAAGGTVQVTGLEVVDIVVCEVRTELEVLQERNLHIDTGVNRIGLVLTYIVIPHIEDVEGAVSGITGTTAACDRPERRVGVVGSITVHLVVAGAVEYLLALIVVVLQVAVKVACIHGDDRRNRHVTEIVSL